MSIPQGGPPGAPLGFRAQPPTRRPGDRPGRSSSPPLHGGRPPGADRDPGSAGSDGRPTDRGSCPRGPAFAGPVAEEAAERVECYPSTSRRQPMLSTEFTGGATFEGPVRQVRQAPPGGPSHRRAAGGRWGLGGRFATRSRPMAGPPWPGRSGRGQCFPALAARGRASMADVAGVHRTSSGHPGGQGNGPFGLSRPAPRRRQGGSGPGTGVPGTACQGPPGCRPPGTAWPRPPRPRPSGCAPDPTGAPGR